MSFRAFKTIWYREIIVHFRDKASVISSIARSIIWLLIFGGGFGAARFAGLEVDYKIFLFPGVIAMSLIFTSMRSGISVIWDREFGFLKEILVSPASRISIMLGKVTGGATIATMEGSVILLLGPFFGLELTITKIVYVISLMFLSSLSLVGMGLVIASFMKSFEGFQVIMTFMIMPMFFLSGALFPLDQLPTWMTFLTKINPLTYGVDSFRIILLGFGNNNIYFNVFFLVSAAIITTVIGSKAFRNE